MQSLVDGAVCSRTALTCFVLVFFTFVSLPACAQTTFSRTEFKTGLQPTCVAAGNLNADNVNDLVTTAFDEDAIVVDLGNSDGTYATPTKFSTPDGPYCLAIVDVNHDHKLDVITANTKAQSVSVFLGNGDGTFQAPTSYPAATPDSIAIGDFNSDGSWDFAVPGGRSGAITVFMNNGTGGFTSHTMPAGDAFVGSISQGDFNGDHKDDLIMVDCCLDNHGTVVIMTGDGAGNFLVWKRLAFPNSVPRAVRAENDFNNDGYSDFILTSAGTPNGARLFLNNHDGSFTTHTYNLPSSSNSLQTRPVWSDFNGDNVLDVAVGILTGPSLTVGKVVVWYLNSNGTLRTRQVLDLGDDRAPRGITNFDATFDQRQDLATANAVSDSVTVFRNGGWGGTCSLPSTSTGIHVCTPTNGSSVSSPVNVLAKGGSAITWMEFWVDGVKKYSAGSNSINTVVSLSPGSHTMNIYAKQSGVVKSKVTVNFTVN